jgi:hypothetical protein
LHFPKRLEKLEQAFQEHLREGGREGGRGDTYLVGLPDVASSASVRPHGAFGDGFLLGEVVLLGLREGEREGGREGGKEGRREGGREGGKKVHMGVIRMGSTS